jgi:hypothetical protein
VEGQAVTLFLRTRAVRRDGDQAEAQTRGITTMPIKATTKRTSGISMPNPKYFKGAKLRAYTAGLIDADGNEIKPEDLRDAALEERRLYDNYDDFRRGYIAGWAGRSNAEDGYDYVAGYEEGQYDRKSANAEARKEQQSAA